MTNGAIAEMSKSSIKVRAIDFLSNPNKRYIISFFLFKLKSITKDVKLNKK